jgi:peptidyl-prolyl cis-trans isomerase SurA
MRDAVELAHILRETSSAGLADARALAKADSLYNLIKSGVPFDSVAMKFSQDKATAKKFGYVGWTQRGDLLQEYENTAFALQPGEISKPIKTRYGYHIIRLNERREDEINTSHILIIPQIAEADEKPIVEFLRKVREEILAGKPFEEAAREYSQDLESAKKGGYLGWFSLEEMPESFRSEIESLKVGEISQPFKTEYGYHIVKLLNRRDARPVTLQQDWEMISQYVLSKKQEKAYNDWLDQLKKRYYIEIKT